MEAKLAQIPQRIIDSFTSTPNPNGCHIVDGKLLANGYKLFGWRGPNVNNTPGKKNKRGIPLHIYGHRLAWIIKAKRDIPAGKQVLHKCDTPSCVNPDHLFLGTHTDNMQDRAKKHRGYGYRLTDKQALEIFNNTETSLRDLADEYGVSVNQILLIKSGKSHGDLTAGLRAALGPKNISRAYPHITKQDIRDIFVSTERTITLTKLYNVSERFVRCIRSRESYTQLTADLHTDWVVRRTHLTDEDIKAIFVSPKSHRSLAKQYDVSSATIWMIRNRTIDRYKALTANLKLAYNVNDHNRGRPFKITRPQMSTDRQSKPLPDKKATTSKSTA